MSKYRIIPFVIVVERLFKKIYRILPDIYFESGSLKNFSSLNIDFLCFNLCVIFKGFIVKTPQEK